MKKRSEVYEGKPQKRKTPCKNGAKFTRENHKSGKSHVKKERSLRGKSTKMKNPMKKRSEAYKVNREL